MQLLQFGDFYQLGEEVIIKIKEKLGFKPTLINPRYITGLDKNLLEELKQNHEIVITLEDGILERWIWRKNCKFLWNNFYES